MRSKVAILSKMEETKNSLGLYVASLFGDSICEIKVESTDGLSCPPSKKGHIDIHEEQNATLLGKIVGHHAP